LASDAPFVISEDVADSLTSPSALTGSQELSAHASQTASPAPGWRLLLGPLISTLALTLVLLTLPRLPLGTDDDSSWSAVVDYAHQQGWQFGTDIAFSYGPLGFLITPYFSPSSPWSRVAADIVLTAATAAGISLLAWRINLVLRCVTLAVVLLLGANADPRSELIIQLGLLSWTLLALIESGPGLKISLAIFSISAVFSVLAKMTLLLPAALSLATLTVCFFLRRKTLSGATLFCGCAAGVLLVWIGLGQQLSNLGPYFLNGLRISAGYDRTMWADPFPILKWPALLMLGLALSVVCIRFTQKAGLESKWSRTTVLIWLAVFMFVIWKHGFVRAGRDQVEIFFGFIPVMVLLLEAWPGGCPVRQLWMRRLALTCSVVAIASFVWLFDGKLGSCLARPFRLAALHANNLVNLPGYQHRLGELQEAERQANQLPRLRSHIGKGSVDVFGCNQSYAIFNTLNFRPRPVFQSYVAYSEALMNLNEQFYFSPRAPQYVLFALSPIDERFPPLEDAPLFRDLFINYEPVDVEGPFLLLKTRQSVAPSLTLLRQGILGIGDVIGLKEYGNANMWLEIELKPNIAGRLAQALYRPSEVTLAVWTDTPNIRVARFRAPAPMLAAGFLASPLPLDHNDVLDLYAGKPIMRPSAYSIELSPAAQYLWSDAINFRLYKIQNALGGSSSKQLDRLPEFPGFEAAPQEIVAPKYTMITVEGKPALYLPPGGRMKFNVSPGTKLIQGSCGFAPASYLLGGATEGAEFRIEEEQPDGSLRILYSQALRPRTNPKDRGMKSFSVSCPAGGSRKLVLRTLAFSQAVSVRDLTCWSEIRFR
jgi:hypothetical protein